MFSRANCLIACWCEGDFATGMQGLAFPVVVGARERLPPNCEHCARPRVRTAPGREKHRPVRAVVGFDRELARSRARAYTRARENWLLDRKSDAEGNRVD